MRYLRMLTNALVGGMLGAAYLTILVLQLNPHIPGRVDAIWPLFMRLALVYGAHLTVAFYVAIVFRELVSADTYAPAWLSVRLLAWLGGGSAALGATLMWVNLWGFSTALDETTARALASGAAALTASAAALLAMAIAFYSSGRRGGRVGAAVLATVVGASMVTPLSMRTGTTRVEARPMVDGVGEAVVAGSPRVFMLLVDGASLDYVSTAVTEGR